MTSIATPAAGLEQLHDVERTIHHLAGRPAVGRVAHLTKGRGATPYFYRKSLRQLSGGPLIGALDADPHDPAQRGASFWYLVAGGLLAALGWNAQRAEANGKPPSAEFAVSLSALGSVGAVASPASPFWAVLAIGLLATYRRRRARSGGTRESAAMSRSSRRMVADGMSNEHGVAITCRPLRSGHRGRDE